jgi:S1-C subfamily serine protease
MPSDKEALDAYSEVVINAAKRIGPTVVQIETNRAPRMLGPGFGDPGGVGLGSGFIYDAKGLILTNAHVVAGAARIAVKFVDGRTAPATLVRGEAREDLALLRISTNDPLPVAELSTEALQPGQLVVAIGNPFGLGWSVTAGVVSAIGRPLDAPQEGISLRNLIQTQTPINPGNSGGPLVNGRGKVVGITTAVVPYGQGIGFAIPVENINDFLTRGENGAQARGRVSMGVAVISYAFEPALVRALSTHQPGGVLVVDIVPESPAARAGLRKGDIIISADKYIMQDPRDLSALIQRHHAGDRLTVTFLREYHVQQAVITLA